MRDFLSKVVLLPEGYTVDTARSGVEGLALALANSPDLIITDYAMPEMTGLDMIMGLREAGRSFPTILITAEGSEEVAVQALRAGVADYFVKPFDPIALLETVHRILESGPGNALFATAPGQHSLDVLNTLMSITRSITTMTDLQPVLDQVTDAAVSLIRADEGVLMLIDQASGELYVRASKHQRGYRGVLEPVADVHAERALRSRQPLLIGQEGARSSSDMPGAHSALYAPLCTNDHALGVIRVCSYTPGRVIARDDIGLAATLADLAALAFVTARHRGGGGRGPMTDIAQYLLDGIIVLDEHDRVALCNPMACQFFDLIPPSQDSTGMSLRDVTTHHGLIALADGATRGEMTSSELPLPDGRIYNAHVSLVPHTGRVFIMQNISHLKELDRAKTELIETVSHQVRSPLTAILSYIDFLNRTGNLNEVQLEFSYQVRRNVQLITDTINDLLELHRLEAGMDRQLEYVAIDEVARYAVEALQGQAVAKKQRLSLRTADPVPTVLGSRVRLRQVFVNLIENAIKYTQEYGRVEVIVTQQGGQVICTVTDTGIGIPMEEQSRVFEKFYRARGISGEYQGTGLGLSIVKTIIEEHDGRIWVESHEGKGTTFTLVLPAG
jgi:two-component system NtrC family sensor kinase